jgi:hypothetical protein
MAGRHIHHHSVLLVVVELPANAAGHGRQSAVRVNVPIDP